MENGGFQRALGRIEAAIERLDGLALPSAHQPPPDARIADLEARNRRLHEGATQALARLDRLIGSAG